MTSEDWLRRPELPVKLLPLGTKVVVMSNTCSHSYTIGKEYTITGYCQGKHYILDVGRSYITQAEFRVIGRQEIKKRKKVNSMMNILVLPEKVKQLILETISQSNAEISEKIFQEWGFASTIEKGKGAILLFWGPPGTGKTMCAEAIAEALGKDYLMLSTKNIQSSVPGQAERNIAKAFSSAHSKDAVVILDECDSLVYSRNKVGAILAAEINTLLTEIERFEGTCILTTNRSHELDPALERRICLKLEFTKPDKASRAKIWRNLIPKEAPLAKCVCFEILSTHDLTGGQIKNAILLGARKAAYGKKKAIELNDFNKGVETELQGKDAFNRRKHFKIVGDNVVQDIGMGNDFEKVIEKVRKEGKSE